MSCPCGGHTLTPGIAKQKTEESAYALSYSTCKSCGLVGLDILFQDDEIMYQGPKARHVFQHIVQFGRLPDILPEQPLFKHGSDAPEPIHGNLEVEIHFNEVEQMSLF